MSLPLQDFAIQLDDLVSLQLLAKVAALLIAECRPDRWDVEAALAAIREPAKSSLARDPESEVALKQLGWLLADINAGEYKVPPIALRSIPDISAQG